MKEQHFAFKRRRGDLDVYIERDGDLMIEWDWGHGYFREDGRVWLTADELKQITDALSLCAGSREDE